MVSNPVLSKVVALKRRHASSLKSQIFQRENLGKRTQKSKNPAAGDVCAPEGYNRGYCFQSASTLLLSHCFEQPFPARRRRQRPSGFSSVDNYSFKKTDHSFKNSNSPNWISSNLLSKNSQTAGQPSSRRFCISFECSAPGLPPESTLCVLRRFQESSATAAPRPFRKCRWRQGRRRAPS